MTSTNAETSAPGLIDKALTVSKGISRRDTQLATSWVNREKFIQHNPQSPDGVEGLEEFIHVLGEPDPFEVVRVFQDGDYVWTHSRGNIFGPKVFFDIFRFEDGLIVEHWDNLVTETPPNESGHTAIDGPREAQDLAATEPSKKLVREFFETAFMGGGLAGIDRFFDGDKLIQHNAHGRDGVGALRQMVQQRADEGRDVHVERIELVLGQGSFVLITASATSAGQQVGVYDLFRVEAGQIAEHWDVLEPIPPVADRRNLNGKF